MLQQLHGPDNYEIAGTLHNRAATAQARGDTTAAQTALKRALNHQTDGSALPIPKHTHWPTPDFTHLAAVVSR